MTQKGAAFRGWVAREADENTRAAGLGSNHVLSSPHGLAELAAINIGRDDFLGVRVNGNVTADMNASASLLSDHGRAGEQDGGNAH